jgi:hypothetical protein
VITDFIQDYGVSNLKDFWECDQHDIPATPGAYLLIARGDTHFHYPLGQSPVFYIGQSKNLRTRLLTHLKYAKQAREDRVENLYWPRYEYAAIFGGRYCFVRTWQGLGPRSLEELIMARFAKKYRSFPIANGSGSWNRVNKIISES